MAIIYGYSNEFEILPVEEESIVVSSLQLQLSDFTLNLVQNQEPLELDASGDTVLEFRIK